MALVVLVAGVRPRDTAYLGIMFVVLMGALVSAEAQSVFRSRPEWREAYPAKERWTGWMTSLSIAMAMLLVLVGWSSGG